MTSTEDLYQLFLKSTGISTDSRKVNQGNLFFALKGANFDGNRFVQQTLDNGAAYAVADEVKLPKDNRIAVVKDTLQALQDLANYHRRQFRIPLIAITGSNGKTTTKELLAAILSNHYRTHFTKGNLNNHIGVPLTLLDMPKDTEIAVVEMGANHIGEIAALCTIAEPTHGVITNVGKAHLEGFGSFEGVKIAKGELYDYLSNTSGVAFINLDESPLNEMGGKVLHKVFYHNSDKPNPDIPVLETHLRSVNPVVEISFLADQREYLVTAKTKLFGHYNFNNIQTAVSIGRYFKVPSEKIKSALEDYTPSNNRSQILRRGTNTFLLDAYNANPTSMHNALQSLDEMPSKHKIAILGDMLELGDFSTEEHQAILDLALEKSYDQLVLVGEAFGKVCDNTSGVLHFRNVEKLKEWFDHQSIDHSLILLKASRSIQLEKLLS